MKEGTRRREFWVTDTSGRGMAGHVVEGRVRRVWFKIKVREVNEDQSMLHLIEF